MDISLASWINLYLFSTNRRTFAIQQVHGIAKALGHGRLTSHAKESLAHDRQTRLLEGEWLGRNTSSSESRRVVEIDVKIDRTVTALRGALVAQASSDDDEDAEVAAQINALLATLFPAGLQAVTQAAFVDELILIEGMIEVLNRKDVKPLVAELGLTRVVKRLTQQAVEYRAAQETPTSDGVHFGSLRAARAKGHAMLLQAVAMILGAYPSDMPSDLDARGRLLAPIIKQNDAIGKYLKARRTVRDVDPETGEEQSSQGAAEGELASGGPEGGT